MRPQTAIYSQNQPPSQTQQQDKTDNDQYFIPAPSRSRRNKSQTISMQNDVDQYYVSKLDDKNSKYFTHLENKCEVCSICICGKHLCDVSLLKTLRGAPNNSVYQQDFVKHPHQNNMRKPDLDSYKDSMKMDVNTIYRLDYPPKRAQSADPCKKREVPIMQPFSSASSYMMDYNNYGQQPRVEGIPQVSVNTLSNLPFTADSLYNKNYKYRPTKKEPFVNFGAKSSFENPICAKMPFFGQTTSNRTFRPFKCNNKRGKRQNQPHSTIPNFDGQFDTEYKSEYVKKPVKVCPAAIYLSKLKSQGITFM